MAVKTNSNVVGVKSSTLAMFEGVFAGVIGLGIAIMWSLSATVNYSVATDSVLKGLVFGLATGVVSLVVIPFVYFGLGWIIGYVHGFVFNVIAETSGGILLRIEQTSSKR